MKWRRRRIAKARRQGRLFGAGAARAAKQERARRFQEAMRDVRQQVARIRQAAAVAPTPASKKKKKPAPVGIDIETLRAMPEPAPEPETYTHTSTKPRRAVKSAAAKKRAK